MKSRVSEMAAHIARAHFAALRALMHAPGYTLRHGELTEALGRSSAYAGLICVGLRNARLVTYLPLQRGDIAVRLTYEGRAVYEYLRRRGAFNPGVVWGIELEPGK